MDLYTRIALVLVCLLKAPVLVRATSSSPAMVSTTLSSTTPANPSTTPTSTTPTNPSTAPANPSTTSANPSTTSASKAPTSTMTSTTVAPTTMPPSTTLSTTTMMSSTAGISMATTMISSSSMHAATTTSTAMSTATAAHTSTFTPTVPPSLGVACDNNSNCMADNSFCYMNMTCKCSDEFLQVNSTYCSPVSMLHVKIMTNFRNQSQIHIEWDPPMSGVNVIEYTVQWAIRNMNESMDTKPPEDRTLIIMVNQPGDEVTLKITTFALDDANTTVNYTTQELLTAEPAKPFFNYSQDFLATSPNQVIQWSQDEFYDRFEGNFSLVDGNTFSRINTKNTEYELTGLIAGKKYIVFLRAVKNNVSGMDATLEFETNPAEPSPPSNVFATNVGQTDFILNVSEPQMPNGMLIGYVFRFEKRLYENSNKSIVTILRNYTEGSMLFNFSNEDLGTNYIVAGAFYKASVYSVNEEFNSSMSFTYEFQTEEAVPGVVNSFLLENENQVVNQANFNWNRPDMPNGNIIAYQLIVSSSSVPKCIEYRICDGMCTGRNISFSKGCENDIVKWSNLTRSQLSVMVQVFLGSQAFNNQYNSTVSAYTAIGGGQTTTRTFRTVVLEPGPPTEVTPQTDSTSLLLTWNPPTVYPGPTVYTVQVKNNVSYSQIENPFLNCNNNTVTSCNIGSLEENWRYSYTIITYTSAGSSVVHGSIRTQEANPDQLTGLTLQQNEDDCQTFILRWQDPPLEDRNSRIDRYEVTSINGQVQLIDSKITSDYDATRYSYSLRYGQLQEDNVYYFRIVAVSTSNRKSEQAITSPLKVTCGTPGGTIAAIIIVFILVLAVILAVIFFVYRRKLKEIEAQYRPNQNQMRQDGFMPVRTDPVQEEMEKQSHQRYSSRRGHTNVGFMSMGNYYDEDIDPKRRKQPKRPFRLCDAQMVFDKMAADSNRLFSLEYEDLKKLSYKGTTDVANMEGENSSGNKSKNRYVNILPFDHSRVTLVPIDEDRCSDYINANYIPGYTYEREFIASQGPLPGTVNDFWRMVWEKSVTIIVMLTKCKEGSADKCEHYWPHVVNEPQQYGDIVVNVISVSNMDKFDINIFHVSQGDYTRTVKHFQFLEWPDFSANVETGTVIDFVQTVRTHITPEMKGPAIIHCSAGVGRTGTYISVDYLLQFVRDKDFSTEIDIFDWVLQMRKNRCSMVQVEKQYIFIHMALLDIIERKKKGLIQDDRDDLKFSIDNEVVYENTAFEGEDDEKMTLPVENSTKEDGQPLTEL